MIYHKQLMFKSTSGERIGQSRVVTRTVNKRNDYQAIEQFNEEWAVQADLPNTSLCWGYIMDETGRIVYSRNRIEEYKKNNPNIQF